MIMDIKNPNRVFQGDDYGQNHLQKALSQNIQPALRYSYMSWCDI